MKLFLSEVLKLEPHQMWGFEQMLVHLKEFLTSFSLQKMCASFLAFIELIGFVASDKPATPRGEALDLTGYSIVFEDEF